MDKKIAILQSNYIPWKGYFDLINMVDEFILFDDMQYTRRDWRNRNKIKTPNGLVWLTIPVEVKGKYHQTIKDTVISDPQWNYNHWKTIVHNYRKAPYFNEYHEYFEDLYNNALEYQLSNINYRFIGAICQLLDIRTKITWSMDYHIVDGKTERLISLCQQVGATEYVSGPAAKSYIDEKLFNQNNIKLVWMEYDNYPEYHQLYPPFDHSVSIIDLILNEGPNYKYYMKSFISR